MDVVVKFVEVVKQIKQRFAFEDELFTFCEILGTTKALNIDAIGLMQEILHIYSAPSLDGRKIVEEWWSLLFFHLLNLTDVCDSPRHVASIKTALSQPPVIFERCCRVVLFNLERC